MEDKIKIAVVNFQTVWGDKTANLKQIENYCHQAGQQQADLIVFPETALTGYTNQANVTLENKMHYLNAETIPGPSTLKLSQLAKQYKMYIVVGMPEKVSDHLYNSAAIIEPSGKISSYRKIHLPFDESEWAIPGNEPVLLDTKWGPIGITICYDTYCFPELLRYYRAKGARLSLNVTACPDADCTFGSAKLAISAYAFVNYMFIASANLCGDEKGNHFVGGSGVVGSVPGNVKAYVGYMFGDENSDKPGLFIGEVDLSLADKYGEIPIFKKDEHGHRDWRNDLYAKLYLET